MRAPPVAPKPVPGGLPTPSPAPDPTPPPPPPPVRASLTTVAASPGVKRAALLKGGVKAVKLSKRARKALRRAKRYNAHPPLHRDRGGRGPLVAEQFVAVK